MNYEDFLDGLDGDGEYEGEVPAYELEPRDDPRAEEMVSEPSASVLRPRDREEPEPEGDVHWRELTVDAATGLPRQAGATMPEGEFVKEFRETAQKDLYVFSKGVMGRHYLTKGLHLPICRGIQKCPPFRKLRLLPRDHAKTSIISHCLPPHVLIQPKDDNIYFPGFPGRECRVLLSGETEGRAKSNLRVIATAFEGNVLLRSLWPEACWDAPKRQARKWNDKEIILPREIEYPDPSVFAIGVGGAITGARPNVIIKDDLISFEAANSDVTMDAAIKWHIASRALMEEYEKDTKQEALEFIIGTRWAVYDLYEFIINGGPVDGTNIPADPTVDKAVRAIVEDGKCIWPERFDAARVAQLRKEFGSMFWLLYMNTASNSDLTDFDEETIRACAWAADGKSIEFEADERDSFLAKAIEEGGIEHPPPLGQRLDASTWSSVFGEGRQAQYMRLKYG